MALPWKNPRGGVLKAKRQELVYARTETGLRTVQPPMRRLGLGLAEARDAVARLPLAALAQNLNSLEPLQNVPLRAEAGRRSQTGML